MGYTLSNVILVDEKLTTFDQYMRYCHKRDEWISSQVGTLYLCNVYLKAKQKKAVHKIAIFINFSSCITMQEVALNLEKYHQ